MIGGGWQPTAAQEALLEVAVGPEAGVAEAWRQWRAGLGNIDPAAVDAGSARILPLFKPRLALLPHDDPALPWIIGSYRRALYHGRLLRARAASALTLFGDAGIATMVSKGGVLGDVYYGDVGLRPMNDFDVLVPHEQAADAVGLLVRSGWRSVQPMPELLPDAYHSACFQSPDRIDFDLHWHLVPEACFAGADDPAWQASQPHAVDGVPTRAPCATDLLTIVCAHAAPWSPVSPARWVADAVMIMRRSANRIDWERVVMLAERWHVVLHLRDTLNYLARRWGADVPQRSLAALDRLLIDRIDRRAYASLGRMPDHLTYLSRPWLRYRLRTRERSALRALPGFAAYLRITLGHASTRGLPVEVVRRYRRWRSDRAHRRR